MSRRAGSPLRAACDQSCILVEASGTVRRRRSPVAQLAEQPAVNRQVFGSSPNGGAIAAGQSAVLGTIGPTNRSYRHANPNPPVAAADEPVPEEDQPRDREPAGHEPAYPGRAGLVGPVDVVPVVQAIRAAVEPVVDALRMRLTLPLSRGVSRTTRRGHRRLHPDDLDRARRKSRAKAIDTLLDSLTRVR